MDTTSSTLSKEQIYDKLKGCIYGAALGDAVGLATEFLSKEQARTFYGVGPIAFGTEKGYEIVRDTHRGRWESGDWTDDTDQQLLIVQSLLSLNGIFNTRDFAKRLRQWAERGFPELENKPPFGIGLTVGSVLKHSLFISTPHRAAWDVWENYDCNLAANGALMRTAILGFPNYKDEMKVVKQTLQATKVTHADPRCCVSSVIVTVLISRLLQGDDFVSQGDVELDHSTKETIAKWMKSGKPANKPEENIDMEDPPETSKKNVISKTLNRVSKFMGGGSSSDPSEWIRKTLKKQQQQSSKSRPDVTIPDDPPASMDTFGADPKLLLLAQNVVNRYKFMLEPLLTHCFPASLSALKLDEPSSLGYVYKCLGSALYCFTRDLSGHSSEGDAFKRIITELTLEAGDADTNGAVAGALLGARIGYKKLPKEWINGLRFTDWLDEKIDRLWTLATADDSVKR
ncbi:10515_t:CDS:2 [Ambispora gerdemannii]|uniref:10515_t:CDS:1 n=1 Tax=Ambispora gerdemannii TaxID=144530 RepID=A0A9N8V4G1_9GLOM|nr:10515_t:CDS:2 [Ambispora gerdemannii]